MKSMFRVLAVVVISLWTGSAQAGVFDLDLLSWLGTHKSARQQAGQPGCCGPTTDRSRQVIKQPCRTSIHTYQRKTAKPLQLPPSGCAKPVTPVAECDTEAAKAAAAERSAAYVIAGLIFRSQTGCYARDRRAAIHLLGDRYDCMQNPEILVAFIYALNDADERVRTKAADEIGDQVRRNPDCIVKEVVASLRQALSDCDPGVRREARDGLSACGFDVVRVADGSCARPAASCVPKTPPKPGYEDPTTGSGVKKTSSVKLLPTYGFGRETALRQQGLSKANRSGTPALRYLKSLLPF